MEYLINSKSDTVVVKCLIESMCKNINELGSRQSSYIQSNQIAKTQDHLVDLVLC